MLWSNYKEQMQEYILYNRSDWLFASLTGMISEYGELIGKVNKRIRSDRVSDEDILLECGDIYWFYALYQLAQLSPSEGNIEQAEMITDILNTFNVSSLDVLVKNIMVFVEKTLVLYGATPSEVCCLNIEKLRSRKERGVLRGDGDYR